MTNRMLTVTNCTTVSGARMSWRLLRETTASSIQALRFPNTTWPITRTGGHTKKMQCDKQVGECSISDVAGGETSPIFQGKASKIFGHNRSTSRCKSADTQACGKRQATPIPREGAEC